MDRSVKKWIKALLMLIIFAGSVALVVIGQRQVGPIGLGKQLLGILGLLLLLGIYNHHYK